MDQHRLEALFNRLHNNQCSDEEIAELNAWFHSLKGGQEDYEVWIKEAGGQEQFADAMFNRFEEKLYKQQKRRSRIMYQAAAAILLFVSVGSLFVNNQKSKKQQLATVKQAAPKANDKWNKAKLTLSNGTVVDLAATKQGKLAVQSGVDIQKTAGNQLIYKEAVNTLASNEIAFNTITTPRAGEYQVVLPDGTSVWLNAESQLRYPVKFSGNERKVELTGEAYFEVAHNARQPFRVVTNEQTVTVLGTHFNIKAYTDDSRIFTTLLQGSVNVINKVSNQSQMLIPGKQCTIIKGEGNILIANAKTDEVMAWKNGYFIFDNEDVKSIMKVISRWYDVDVTYNLTHKVRLGGTFSRSSDLDELLKDFAAIGNLKFEQKERRIIVSN